MSTQLQNLVHNFTPKLKCLLGFCLVFNLLPSQADDYSPSITGWYVSPMIAVVDDGDERDVDDRFAHYQFGVGKKYSELESFEFTAALNRFNADGFNGDQTQWTLGIEAIREFKGAERFVPYGILGVGYTKTQNDNVNREDGRGLSITFGGGYMIHMEKLPFTLRVDLRARNDRSADSHVDVLLGFGVRRMIKSPPIIIFDADKDGVSDADDRCGNTASGSAVDRFGCAL